MKKSFQFITGLVKIRKSQIKCFITVSLSLHSSCGGLYGGERFSFPVFFTQWKLKEMDRARD